MRIAVLLLLIASAGSLAVAKDPDAETEAPHPDIHQQLFSELHSEFKFVPTPRAPVPVAPFLSEAGRQHLSPVPEADDPDVVRMAPFIVRGTRETVDLSSLHADILQEESDAHTTAIMNKLGTGEYVKHWGKVDYGARTIFFIPVAFGFRW